MAKVSDFDYSAELMADYLRGAAVSPNIIPLICGSTLMRILRLTSQGARRRPQQAVIISHCPWGGRKSTPLHTPAMCDAWKWKLRCKKKKKKEMEITFGYSAYILLPVILSG